MPCERLRPLQQSIVHVGTGDTTIYLYTSQSYYSDTGYSPATRRVLRLRSLWLRRYNKIRGILSKLSQGRWKPFTKILLVRGWRVS